MDFWQLMEQTGAEEKLVVLDYLCVFACFSRFEDMHLKLNDNCSDNGGLLEDFFIAHSKRSGKTSNHTLSLNFKCTSSNLEKHANTHT